MSYNSKKSIAGMAAGIITVAVYVVYVLEGGAPAGEDVQAWAKLMLIFIGIGVAAQIVVQVVFHTVLEAGIEIREHGGDCLKMKKMIDATVAEDERDKLINLKSLRVGYICSGFGLMIALFMLASGAPVVIALHFVVGAAVIGSLAEGCAAVIFNEKGVKNG